MGLLRLVDFPLDDVVAAWGRVPEPGTHFEYRGVTYESVMLNLTTVFAIPTS